MARRLQVGVCVLSSLLTATGCDSSGSSAHSHPATELTGVFNASQLPIGGGAGQVAGGDHVHDGRYVPVGDGSTVCSANPGVVKLEGAAYSVCDGAVWRLLNGVDVTLFEPTPGRLSRRWADGSVATSCWEYRSPAAPRRYQGSTGSGRYQVDPDGAGGVAPFDVYCDMATDGGGWTLVDNDATNGGTFFSRTVGANDDVALTRGAYLPGYAWSPDPQLLCRTSNTNSGVATADWVSFRATGAYALEYPTATTATASYSGEWQIVQLNGNNDQGAGAWMFSGSGRFGSVYIGNGANPTCACAYTGTGTGRGASGDAVATTCSIWVR
jgi:hypothetical protein